MHRKHSSDGRGGSIPGRNSGGMHRQVQEILSEGSQSVSSQKGEVTWRRAKTKDKNMDKMKTPPVVSAQEWEAARQQLLIKEKAFTRSRDALAAERRRMPWTLVGKKYEFEGPKGKLSLLDLFEGRRQLIVYRAFFEPGVFGWPSHRTSSHTNGDLRRQGRLGVLSGPLAACASCWPPTSVALAEPCPSRFVGPLQPFPVLGRRVHAGGRDDLRIIQSQERILR